MRDLCTQKWSGVTALHMYTLDICRKTFAVEVRADMPRPRGLTLEGCMHLYMMFLHMFKVN